MRILILTAILGLAACQPMPSPQPAQISIPVQTAAPSGSIMSILNSERAAQGLGPLRENARLSQASRAHAQDMANNGYFSHNGRNGSSFVDRARAAGYTCPAAENIAQGQTTEAVVMTTWMNSSGHRRNIMLSNTADFGIGRAGNVWVMMFGRGC